MKTPALIVVVMAVALVVSAANSQEAGKDLQEASTNKIKELQKQRITTLKDMSEMTVVLFQQARGTMGDACEAKSLLLNAELEVAEKESDRIKLYEDFIEAMKVFEELATARKQGARGNHADILKPRAIRLDAEIALERVRAKAAK